MKNLKLSFAIAFAAIFGFAGKSNAQTTPRVGIKAGLTYMTLGSATFNGVSINYKYRPGFQGGVTFETPISEAILFNPQVLYTQKGGDINTTISGINISGYSQVNYIDVPLLFGFKANPALSFFVGPQVSFLTSTKSVATVNNATVTSTDKSGIKNTMLGGNLGAGYEISNNVGINLNYIFDFGRAGEGANDTGERNSGFILSLGLKF